MSTGADLASHRVHWPRQWVVWFLVCLVGVAGIGVGIDRAFFSGGQVQYSWPPEPCVVEGSAPAAVPFVFRRTARSRTGA